MEEESEKEEYAGTCGATWDTAHLTRLAVLFAEHRVLLLPSKARSYHVNQRRRRAMREVSRALAPPILTPTLVSQTVQRFIDIVLTKREESIRAGRGVPAWVRTVEPFLGQTEAPLPDPAEGVLRALTERARALRTADPAQICRELPVAPRARPEQLACVWARMAAAARAKLDAFIAGGDSEAGLQPGMRLSRAEWRLVDALILHDHAEPLRVVKEEHARRAEPLRALVAVFHLVQLYRLEDGAAPAAWRAAAAAYRRRGRLASAVLLQRRWHDLKLQTRRRVAAASRAGPGTRPGALPAPLHLAVVRRFPQVVVAPLPTWRSLVCSRAVLEECDLTKDISSLDELPAEEGGVEEWGELEPPPAAEEAEDDLILVEREIETVDLLAADDELDQRVETAITSKVTVKTEAGTSAEDTRVELRARRRQMALALERELDKQLRDLDEDQGGLPPFDSLSGHSPLIIYDSDDDAVVTNSEKPSRVKKETNEESWDLTTPERVRRASSEQTTPDRVRSVSSEQTTPARVRSLSSEQTIPDRVRSVSSEQTTPARVRSRSVSSEQTTPDRARSVSSEQTTLARVRSVSSERTTPARVRSVSSEQTTPHRVRSVSSEQTTPDRAKSESDRTTPERVRNVSEDEPGTEYDLCIDPKLFMTTVIPLMRVDKEGWRDLSPSSPSVTPTGDREAAEMGIRIVSIKSESCRKKEEDEEEGSRRGRIRLPDISEVRRINSGMKTAQVAPLVSPTDAPAGFLAYAPAYAPADVPATASAGSNVDVSSRRSSGEEALCIDEGEDEDEGSSAAGGVMTGAELRRVLRACGWGGGAGGGGGAAARGGGGAAARGGGQAGGTRWRELYCCAARYHRALNDARRRCAARGGRPPPGDAPVHAARCAPPPAPAPAPAPHGNTGKEAAPCRCCCAHLLDAAGAARALQGARARLLADVRAVLAGTFREDASPPPRAIDEGTPPRPALPTAPQQDVPEPPPKLPPRKRVQKKKRVVPEKKVVEPPPPQPALLDPLQEWIRQKNLTSRFFDLNLKKPVKPTKPPAPIPPSTPQAPPDVAPAPEPEAPPNYIPTAAPQAAAPPPEAPPAQVTLTPEQMPVIAPILTLSNGTVVRNRPVSKVKVTVKTDEGTTSRSLLLRPVTSTKSPGVESLKMKIHKRLALSGQSAEPAKKLCPGGAGGPERLPANAISLKMVQTTEGVRLMPVSTPGPLAPSNAVIDLCDDDETTPTPSPPPAPATPSPPPSPPPAPHALLSSLPPSISVKRRESAPPPSPPPASDAEAQEILRNLPPSIQVKRKEVPPVSKGVPPVGTEAPPVSTGVPPVGTEAPSVSTAVPPVGTEAPPVSTGVPPVGTEAPPVSTGVPPVATGVPPVATGVPPVATGVPPVAPPPAVLLNERMPVTPSVSVFPIKKRNANIKVFKISKEGLLTPSRSKQLLPSDDPSPQLVLPAPPRPLLGSNPTKKNTKIVLISRKKAGAPNAPGAPAAPGAPGAPALPPRLLNTLLATTGSIKPKFKIDEMRTSNGSRMLVMRPPESVKMPDAKRPKLSAAEVSSTTTTPATEPTPSASPSTSKSKLALSMPSSLPPAPLLSPNLPVNVNVPQLTVGTLPMSMPVMSSVPVPNIFAPVASAPTVFTPSTGAMPCQAGPGANMFTPHVATRTIFTQYSMLSSSMMSGGVLVPSPPILRPMIADSTIVIPSNGPTSTMTSPNMSPCMTPPDVGTPQVTLSKVAPPHGGAHKVPPWQVTSASGEIHKVTSTNTPPCDVTPSNVVTQKVTVSSMIRKLETPNVSTDKTTPSQATTPSVQLRKLVPKVAIQCTSASPKPGTLETICTFEVTADGSAADGGPGEAGVLTLQGGATVRCAKPYNDFSVLTITVEEWVARGRSPLVQVLERGTAPYWLGGYYVRSSRPLALGGAAVWTVGPVSGCARFVLSAAPRVRRVHQHEYLLQLAPGAAVRAEWLPRSAGEAAAAVRAGARLSLVHARSGRARPVTRARAPRPGLLALRCKFLAPAQQLTLEVNQAEQAESVLRQNFVRIAPRPLGAASSGGGEPAPAPSPPPAPSPSPTPSPPPARSPLPPLRPLTPPPPVQNTVLVMASKLVPFTEFLSGGGKSILKPTTPEKLAPPQPKSPVVVKKPPRSPTPPRAPTPPGPARRSSRRAAQDARAKLNDLMKQGSSVADERVGEGEGEGEEERMDFSSAAGLESADSDDDYDADDDIRREKRIERRGRGRRYNAKNVENDWGVSGREELREKETGRDVTSKFEIEEEGNDNMEVKEEIDDQEEWSNEAGMGSKIEFEGDDSIVKEEMEWERGDDIDIEDEVKGRFIT